MSKSPYLSAIIVNLDPPDPSNHAGSPIQVVSLTTYLHRDNNISNYPCSNRILTYDCESLREPQVVALVLACRDPTLSYVITENDVIVLIKKFYSIKLGRLSVAPWAKFYVDEDS
jgi:hypothetical protein